MKKLGVVLACGLVFGVAACGENSTERAVTGATTGALVAGLLVGIVQSVMTTVWPEGARLMIYIGMALVIATMPRGLLGRA